MTTSDGQHRTVSLYHRTVAGFYREFMDAAALAEYPRKDLAHARRSSESHPLRSGRHALRLRSRVRPPLLAYPHHARPIFKEFRGRFIGKSSPVHFFWGSFDFAVTRFSGRRAPERPGADKVTKEAYSHEVSSVGWWPGAGEVATPMFYSYAAPEPPGFKESKVLPAAAFHSSQLNEFLLSYDDVRSAPDPKAAVLAFCQSTYEAAAINAKWDRPALEHNYSDLG